MKIFQLSSQPKEKTLAIDALKDKFGEQIIQRGLTQNNTKNVPEGQKK